MRERRRLGSRKRAPRHPLYARREEFVEAAGAVVAARIETGKRPERIDHVWIEINAGESGPLRLALTTRSLKGLDAGFDPRVWVGVVVSPWHALPPPGIRSAESLDYSTIEAISAVEFMPYQRAALETFLIEQATHAVWVQAWGDLYVRDHAGVHQIHSRRARFPRACRSIRP